MQCNNNLEIRIAGSSCRIVFNFFWDLQLPPRETDNNAYAKFWRDNKEYYGIFWKRPIPVNYTYLKLFHGHFKSMLW